MKDSNGGDIPGTVLESINASDRLETAIIGTDCHRHDYICNGFPHDADYYVDLNANNGYDSGVNPTHCTETAHA